MGWIFTEMGRQPWTVFGILTTRQSVSPGVTASSVIISLAVFTLLYGFLAAIAGWLAIRQVKDGAPALAEGSAGEPCTPRSTPWLTRPRAAAGC
jgi:cytochrome d ubiquinol oxidase subunit I